MIVFGSLGPRQDDPLRAVTAAAVMQAAAAGIDRELRLKNGLRLKIGIGISTGTVFSGLLGSIRKKEFTSVGMAVNIAARLQALAAPGEILISEKTFLKIQSQKRVGPNGAADFSIAARDPMRVKGLQDPIAIYRVDQRVRTV